MNPDTSRGRLITYNNNEALMVSVAALKSLTSDYALRTRQAEEMCSLLISEKIPKEIFQDVIVNKLTEHISTRGLERSTQLFGVIQTTLMALTNIHRGLKNLTPEELDQQLLEIIKALTITCNPS